MEMIVSTNPVPGDMSADPDGDDLCQTRATSRKERRLERLRAWRAANRADLQEYQRKWRADHPDRVRIYREREYERRKETRRRLRLRREAQRRRRPIKRAELMRRYQPSIVARTSRPSSVICSASGGVESY